MKGFIDFLLSDDDTAKWLRDKFVIKIIPMLNPDGVIVGNHRCNLKGYDLNRQWGASEAKRDVAPEIFGARDMIEQSTQTREVLLFCDLHGHSRKHGIFMYGCNNDSSLEKRFKERIFPFMLSQNAKDLFEFKRCQFKIQKCKEKTGRINIWRSFDIMNSFTMEASFCGNFSDGKGGFHYSISHLQDMGKRLAITIYKYANSNVKTIHNQIKHGLEHKSPEFIAESSDDSGDTTSDDEKLRIKPKKKKILKKSEPKPPTERVAPTPPKTTSKSSLNATPSKTASLFAKKDPIVKKSRLQGGLKDLSSSESVKETIKSITEKNETQIQSKEELVPTTAVEVIHSRTKSAPIRQVYNPSKHSTINAIILELPVKTFKSKHNRQKTVEK